MKIPPELLRLYKEARQYRHGTNTKPIYHGGAYAQYSATEALAFARRDMTNGKKAYSDEWPWQRGAHNVTRQQKERLGDNYAWIENTRSAGLRFVGYADEICRAIRHTGWFATEDNWFGVTYRGAVWQLPARNGVARYIAGYVDPNNEGAAFVSLDVVCEASSPRKVWDSRKRAYAMAAPLPQGELNDESKREAALAADEIARIYAEKERDYRAVANARFRYDEIPEQIATERSAIRELIKELRAARKAITRELPRSCALLRAHIRKGLDAIQKLRDERETLAAEWSGANGWGD